MYNGRTVGVVIPAYNESAHIGRVIESVPAYVDRVYAVDDGSKDHTWEVLRECADRTNDTSADSEAGYAQRVLPIRHVTNRGAGGAILTGYEHALADQIEVVAVMDGDGQMDPADLEQIIDPVASGEADYAKGNRLHHRDDRAAMPGWRLFGNALLTMLTRVASGYWEMSDPQNGFTAISGGALAELPFDRLHTGYGFLNHLLIWLNINRKEIVDVAHRGHYGDESSGIRYRTFVPGLSLLLAKGFLHRQLRCYLLQRLHPVVGCYALGILVFLFGLGATGVALGTPSIPTFLGTLTAIGVASLGCLLLLLGSWFDVWDNQGLVTRRDNRVRPPRQGVPRRQRPVAPPAMEALGDGGRPGPDEGE